MNAEEFRESVLALFFPHRCVCCGELAIYPNRFCEKCRDGLPEIDGETCPYCGSAEEDCVCGKRKKPYDRCISPFYYEGKIRSAVLRMKRAERKEAFSELAGEMVGAFIRSGEDEPDIVAYVPATKRDERKRGYNQSKKLAENAARRLGIPLRDVLIKTRQTLPQKSLDSSRRAGNVSGVFDVAPGADVKGKSVLLVDDLVTTGATAGECAKVLKLYGAVRVVLLTLAIDVPNRKNKFPK